ncbi:hypothetical protein M413DRAFT_16501 [Hebeloma cylindrosporum]|uniref:DUF7582 domain-containing protein n=1 Tax=Hebeloma cylindrosporum TaxID=76867 RepID=A0A0C3CDT5_HEBCY|nr:hypothetical protein M413DRAFT_16501 [Hebeloma cylindrosporum h7]
MGNCLSGSRSDTANLRDLLDRPGVVDPQLSSDQIKEALGEVAKELEKKKHNVVIVAVGGAINTVLLGTRASTADVDFFGNGKGIPAELKAATEAVTKKLGLAKGWLNNHTALFINADKIESLYDDAIKDNIVVFKKPGLTVLAAPWKYSLVAKVEKAGKGTAKPYDIKDAAGYLHQLIQAKKKKEPVKESELKAWATEYRATISQADIDKVAAEYKKQYAQDGIIKR